MDRRLSTELTVLVDRVSNRARQSNGAYDSHLPVGHLDDVRMDEASFFP